MNTPAILELLDVGKFDPLNREYLDEKMIFPNRKIKSYSENNQIIFKI